MSTSAPSPLKHSLFRLISDALADELPIIRCTKSTLVHLSHTLEDTILKNYIPAMLLTGFQESSHWRAETARYRQLAEVVQQVCIFAGKPLPPESHAKQLHIELADDDPLRQEWFLLILSDEFSVLLCGQDRLQDVSTEADREFDTIWTFDIEHITRTLDILEQVVLHYRPDRLQSLRESRQSYQLKHISEKLLSQFVMDVLAYEASLNKEIREQTTWLETVMSNVGQYAYIIEIDSQGKGSFRPIFGDFQKLFGYPFQEGDDPFEWFDVLVHPDDKPLFYANQKRHMQNVPVHSEYRYVHKDGHIIWLTVTSRTVSTAEGKIIRYGVAHDITPLRESERIKRENERLEQELEQEKQLNATRTYFMNSIMHEFRNPLASVLLASEMLERYKDRMTEEEKDKRLQTIQQQITQLRTILDDMSLILNNQFSEMGFHPNPEDANAYFGEVVARFRAGKGAGHLIVFESFAPSDLILLDRRLLKYATSALLSNAANYSPSGTTITLQLYQEGDEIVFSVADEGIGIPHNEQPRIFEPLFRASNVPPKNHGGGLGLMIAKECTELHGGTLTFISEMDVGSTFYLRLPYQLA